MCRQARRIASGAILLWASISCSSHPEGTPSSVSRTRPYIVSAAALVAKAPEANASIKVIEESVLEPAKGTLRRSYRMRRYTPEATLVKCMNRSLLINITGGGVRDIIPPGKRLMSIVRAIANETYMIDPILEEKYRGTKILSTKIVGIPPSMAISDFPNFWRFVKSDKYVFRFESFFDEFTHRGPWGRGINSRLTLLLAQEGAKEDINPMYLSLSSLKRVGSGWLPGVRLKPAIIVESGKSVRLLCAVRPWSTHPGIRFRLEKHVELINESGPQYLPFNRTGSAAREIVLKNRTVFVELSFTAPANRGRYWIRCHALIDLSAHKKPSQMARSNYLLLEIR